MSERLNDIVVGVFNDWFLSQHGLLPEQAITRIAELEAQVFDDQKEFMCYASNEKRLKATIKWIRDDIKNMKAKAKQVGDPSLIRVLNVFCEGIEQALERNDD